MSGGDPVIWRAVVPDPNIHEELPEKQLSKQLAVAVREIQWSYAFFWSTSTRQPGVLEWSEGCYNGEIKTRKTTQSTEPDPDQVGLRRSKQLRELYESLLSGDSNQQTRRPSASLSPEDLTEAEWYYLLCMSFTFSTGQGYTVVCIPVMGGVLELGTTEFILEDPALIKQITSFFHQLPNPVWSEQATSTPQVAENDEDMLCPVLDHERDNSMLLEDQKQINICQTHLSVSAEQTDSVQYKFGGEHVGSSRDRSNDCWPIQLLEDLFGIDSLDGISQTQNWQFIGDDEDEDEFSNGLHGSLNSNERVSMSFVNAQRVASSTVGERTTRNQMLMSLDLDGHDPHHAKTIANILQTPKHAKPDSCFPRVSDRSSFINWRRSMNTPKPCARAPQELLKKIFMDRAWLGGGHQLKRRVKNGLPEKIWRPEGGARASHVLSERKRREKLNEKFLVLRSLIPSVSKVDKASVLGDTIEYLKDLERRVQKLESCRGSVERRKHFDVAERTTGNEEIMNGKRKACDVDEAETEHHCSVSKDGPIHVTVTMKETEVSIELRCPWREHLLFEIIGSMSNLRLDPLSVQSSTVDGMLALTLESKVWMHHPKSPLADCLLC
ncbi:anthocyanin regulatory Lc protein [Musa troglodytarum]|uniref:Anthocyanin regulatory Lc protein n=1 Tax=Musa troglodytarum TaxID=320322 RepID=A0A9E7ENG9_9LILI|nr:anthocyanin regulatory Lc protein [Musa troglodytarum]